MLGISVSFGYLERGVIFDFLEGSVWRWAIYNNIGTGLHKKFILEKSSARADAGRSTTWTPRVSSGPGKCAGAAPAWTGGSRTGLTFL